MIPISHMLGTQKFVYSELETDLQVCIHILEVCVYCTSNKATVLLRSKYKPRSLLEKLKIKTKYLKLVHNDLHPLKYPPVKMTRLKMQLAVIVPTSVFPQHSSSSHLSSPSDC